MEQITNEQSFQQFIQSSPKTLVEFYASWCPHCKAFFPVLEQASQQLASQNIPCAQVEIDNNEEIANAYGIEEIPTLVLFENGKPVKKSAGSRSEEAVIEFVS